MLQTRKAHIKNLLLMLPVLIFLVLNLCQVINSYGSNTPDHYGRFLIFVINSCLIAAIGIALLLKQYNNAQSVLIISAGFFNIVADFIYINEAPFANITRSPNELNELLILIATLFEFGSIFGVFVTGLKKDKKLSRVFLFGSLIILASSFFLPAVIPETRDFIVIGFYLPFIMYICLIARRAFN